MKFMKAAGRASARQQRKIRIRKKIHGTQARPRLAVFRLSRYIYAQLIDDLQKRTLCACSSLEKSLKGQLKSTGNVDAAREVGKTIAQRAKEKNVEAAVFDRSGYFYHGRVKALADGAREAGMKV